MKAPASEGVESGHSHRDSGCALDVSSILAFVGVGRQAERLRLGHLVTSVSFLAKRGCWYGIPRALFFHRTQNTDYMVFHLHITL